MKAFDREVPAAPDTALPVITFTENATFYFYFNDNEIRVMHLANAHTDGDSAVHFADANVMHTGDTFFNGFFPFIDQSSGGSVDGVIAAVNTIMQIVDDDTRIIPGHGPLASKADLQTYLDMLMEVKSVMSPLVNSDQSRDEVLASQPLAKIGETWGAGFLDTDAFTGIVYDVISGK